MKLNTNIHHVSGNSWTGFQGHRSKVKVKTTAICINVTCASLHIYIIQSSDINVKACKCDYCTFYIFV